MKSKYLAGLTGIGLLAGLVAACGDSGATGTGGAATTSTSTSTGSSSSKGVTSATSTGTGMMGDGNDTIDTATALTAGQNGAFTTDPNATPALDPPNTDVDFYKFTATKGPWDFFTQTNPNNDSGVHIDTVITLFDSSKKQIARNDDGFPRTGTDSTLSTILQADGEYYVKVEEFCSSDLATTPCPADYFTNITDNTYFLAAVPLTKEAVHLSELPEVEPNDTSATATMFGYNPVPMKTGSYYLSVVWGDMQTLGDEDWLSFTIPADVTTTVPISATQNLPGRVSAGITIPPPSTAGNGSDLNLGVVDVVDSADMSVVGRLDFTNEPTDGTRSEMSIPLQLNHQYFIHMKAGNYSATGGAGKFYFFEQSAASGNPIEGELLPTPVTNNSVATAEALTGGALNGGGTGFFVEGDLPAGDVDYFKVTIPSAGTKASVFCSGERMGTGLRTLKATLLDATGTNTIGTDTESATHDLGIQDKTVTGGADVIVKVEATQDTTVTSPAYRCVVVVP